FRLNLPKCVPFVLLVITFAFCLHSQAYAAKITTKTTNTTTSITNSSNVELNSATEESKVVAAKVAVMPPALTADATAEVKAAKEDDTELDIDSNASKDENTTDPEDVEDADDDEDDDDADENDEADKQAGKPSKSETALEAAEKDDDTASTFSVWGIVRTVWSWIKDDISESLFGDDDADTTGATKALVRQIRDVPEAGKTAVESRTFGKIRRLQMALIPLIFKFGILTAMVAFLIMLGMKTLFLVKLLVLMNAAAILAKFITLKSDFGGHGHSGPSWNYQSWTPPVTGGWAASAPAASYSHGHEHQPTKEIHLHIHGGQVHGYDGASSSQGVVSGGHGWTSRSDPYNTYASTQDSESENELSNKGPIAMLPTRYPAINPY
ncbi:PREDICTED: uncharacterized protein LOC108377043, partial [Rhagoletis zephyria]|uniref:uncharacterized protein LOC108377043 n=1 Tax=Rhagoletis zephyria TaxID=28612 RepID=UPI000811478F